MAVMARETWTDQRLDDLNKRVDAGFSEMRQEFRAVRSEMQSVRHEAKEELQAFRKEMVGELRAIRGEIGALNRSVIQLAFAMVGTVFLGFMGTIAALVTLV
jgi:hypothetical protein